MSSFFILRRLEKNMITHIQDGAFDGLKDLFEMWVWNPFVETCICIKLAFFRYLVEGEKSPADRFFFMFDVLSLRNLDHNKLETFPIFKTRSPLKRL